MQQIFEMNGRQYTADPETVNVLRLIVPDAKKTGDASAVAAVMVLGEMAGRIIPKSMQNKHCSIEYREDEKQIFMRDLRDMMNEPAIYTKSKRGLKNAWAAIVAAWDEDTTMSDIGKIFTEYGIKYHYWCMVD